jgi:hypothetical protein
MEQSADQRVKDLHRRNNDLAQTVLLNDRELHESELSMRVAALEMAANLEELYNLKAFNLPINCIFNVILTELKKNGLSESGRRALYRVFDTEETKKFRFLTNIETSYTCDNVTNIANIHEELDTQQKQITESINTLKRFDCMPQYNKDLYRDATESLLDITQSMVQNCDNNGILLLQHNTQQQRDNAKKLDTCRIKKPDPAESDITGWLKLLIEELQKVHDKFLSYHPEKIEDAINYCQGIKVHVQLLRSIVDDKWARNYWAWLGVIKEMKSQSKHSAMSKSGIMGAQGRIRKLTREQIGDKADEVLEFAMQFIEHSPAYWDLMYASAKLREPLIAELHNDRRPKLIESS